LLLFAIKGGKMVCLYIGSTKPYSGKSLTSLIISLKLKERKRLAYFKPVGTLPRKVKGKFIDEDALFINKYLGLNEDISLLSPVIRTRGTILKLLKERESLVPSIKKTFNKLSSGKDIVVASGVGSLESGASLGISGIDVAKALKAKVLLVSLYTDELIADGIILAKELLKDALIGVIINKVREDRIDDVKKIIIPSLSRKNIKVLGVIPEDKILEAASIEELTEELNGKILCGSREKGKELVKNFSVGAMSMESALRYFRALPDKVVITGGDRSDIQLAALETDTKAIILTGKLYPNSLVLSKAKEMGIPLILVSTDTLTTVEKIDELLGKMRVRSKTKIERAEKLFAKNLNFPLLFKDLKL